MKFFLLPVIISSLLRSVYMLVKLIELCSLFQTLVSRIHYLCVCTQLHDHLLRCIYASLLWMELDSSCRKLRSTFFHLCVRCDILLLCEFWQVFYTIIYHILLIYIFLCYCVFYPCLIVMRIDQSSTMLAFWFSFPCFFFVHSCLCWFCLFMWEENIGSIYPSLKPKF